MKQCFVEKKFRQESLALIYKINRIIEEYQEQGYEFINKLETEGEE